MPKIVCRACGRVIYATVPVEQLFAEERRCTRCGAAMSADRRAVDRRTTNRRSDPPTVEPRAPDDPSDNTERRAVERRAGQRRGSGDASRRSPGASS